MGFCIYICFFSCIFSWYLYLLFVCFHLFLCVSFILFYYIYFIINPWKFACFLIRIEMGVSRREWRWWTVITVNYITKNLFSINFNIFRDFKFMLFVLFWKFPGSFANFISCFLILFSILLFCFSTGSFLFPLTNFTKHFYYIDIKSSIHECIDFFKLSFSEEIVNILCNIVHI